MKASELREKSAEDLNKQLLTLREEQFKLRMQKSTGQLGQTHLAQANQRDIARVKTVLTEKAGNKNVSCREAYRVATGKVVSNKMDKTIHCDGRASGEAPCIWQVHYTLFEDPCP